MRARGEWTQLLIASWPGLSRPSTLLLLQQGKDVDSRDKPGHDESGSISDSNSISVVPAEAGTHTP
jgi:hypothetical protein